MPSNSKEYSKNWRDKNRIRVRVLQRNWCSQNTERVAEIKRKTRYGISVDDFSKMLYEQKGLCAICEEEIKNKKATVDHNHIDGKIRGLLCRKCNAGLGQFKDSVKSLARAIFYLRGEKL